MFYSKTALLDSQTQLSARNLATRLVFFALGFGTAAWAPLIPLVQQRLHLNHADFGVMLLSMGIGSMLSMPITGALITKVGCRLLIAIAIASIMIILPVLSVVQSSALLAIVLFIFGSAAGSLGVAINFQAVVVEKQNLKTMMSGFHGMCSLGGLCGVLLMTALLVMGSSPLLATLIISSILLVIFVGAVPYCVAATKRKDKIKKSTEGSLEKIAIDVAETKKAEPNFAIILIGIMCFIAFLSEGAAMDWSGIYLVSKFGLDASFAGLAYTFFAITMTIGRFSGQRLLSWCGEQRLIVIGALCAAMGLLTIVVAGHWSIVLFGYALLGLGCSNLVPIMFSRVGRQNIMPKAAALSLVSTIAYSGSLSGPALVGFLSEMIGLSYVFAIIAMMLSGIAILSRFTKITESN